LEGWKDGRMEEWKIGRGFTTETRRTQRKLENRKREEFDNLIIEDWKNGRLEEVLPRRHGGHKGSTKIEK